MVGTRFRPVLGLVVALTLALGWSVAPPTAPSADAALPAWKGGVNLYRDGVFTTQKTWLWCTAAGVQIASNIVAGKEDHSTSAQRRYFDLMRKHNRYRLPESAGVDPQGWTAGLRQFVDDRYRLVASKTFDSALRSAVTRLRQTNLPVAITVSHGNHGWVLNGFTATADPLTTKSFKVTSVRVTGPLYGRQSKNGYDMKPNTKLTPAQLKRFFTPWKYKPKKMVWDGLYVSIQPVPAKTKAAPRSTPVPVVVASPSPSPTASPSPRPTPSPFPSASPTPPPTVAQANPAPSASPIPASDAVASGVVELLPEGLAILAVLTALGGIVLLSAARRDGGAPGRR